MDENAKRELNTIKETLEIDMKEEAIKRHPKASFEDLISELSMKGIKFNVMSENDAKDILNDLNYYYKLSVYRRNFKRDLTGKYVNLEFSYLADLASVDMQLRYLLLTATLDIEHAMKTFLITHITENEEVDGYAIVDRFFHSTIGTEYVLNKKTILEKVKHKSHYQRKLYEAHKDAPSAWVLVEIMSFGEFIRFFEFYFKKYPTPKFDLSIMSGLLNAVKRIRNCCAHNNAFLFYMSKNELRHPNSYVVAYAEEAKIGKAFYSCAKVHDIIAVLYTHNFFVKGIGSRKYRHKELSDLTDRSSERFKCLDKDNDIVYFFGILKKLLNSYHV
ncbi:Abi family protein [Enterococcus durans]|uniref:Abi family protein n=1 Tax=Enterococcus durans TaxID=53345 RepID=A0A5N0YYV2_9ENTE|nr:MULTISPECIES: Abi family protein [Enterococcus]EGP5538795.1 Abi family protein [Enterococcus faecium]EGP5669547.1 Abi family protein [Enterococcus faecium]KAA9181079.1 Abi family protein [Enterococcus durans]KAA9188404.1 Abi family protein [Enterococcus durans]KAA9188820.1 Abi family protein [Enterococcus durans]